MYGRPLDLPLQASVSKPPPSSVAHRSVEDILSLDNAFSLIEGTKKATHSKI
jgi:hypothetical protein